MRIRSLTLSLAFSLPVVLSVSASAQSFTPVRELKNLSPAALEKIHTLETLNALPGGDWRFHPGDIPHGESTTLDDSSWQLVHSPATRAETLTAPKEAVWYRRTIEVPRTLNGYDISGSRIWFQFHVDANGPIPQIIYFNGRRVALGDDLEPIVLFEPARPGDKILVAVKLLHTVDEKRFEGVNLRIEPVEPSTDFSSRPEARSSAAERPASGTANPGAPGPDFRTRVSTTPRPNPDDLRQEIITAANMLPALSPPRTDLLKTVEDATAAIDTDALKSGNQAAFDASLRKAQFLLSPLQALISKDKVILAGNAHIDAAWLWPRSETIDVVKRTFTTALQLMDEYPDYTYTQSAAQYSAWIADKYPDLNKQIAARVKEGRWEIVGGMWIEPDLNLPGGESLVRQLLVGQREFQRLYGVTARIGWNPDSFGYNWQLPQIYKRSGLDYFVTQKMHWNDTNTLPFRLFWWQSPDGSKVLTYFPTDYVHDNVNPTRISADFAESVQRNPGLTEHLDLYGIGDHGGGPTRSMLDQANHWIAISNSTSTPSSDFSSRPDPEQAKRAEGEVERPASGTTTALKGTGFSPSVEAKDGKGALAPEGPDVPAPIPTMHYGTAQHFFSDVETHLNPNSPVWNYDLIAKGYNPPQTGPGLSPPGTDQAPQGFSPATNPSPGTPLAPQGFSPATNPSPGTPLVPQGFSLGSHSDDKMKGGVSTPPLIGLPTWNSELYFEYHRGVFTTQAAHKRNMRTSETQTLDAEKLASLAWLNGAPYPTDVLTENWKKIAFNQFHDLAAGSGVAVIYRDAKQDFTEVANANKQIDESSRRTVGAKIDTTTKTGVPILIYNSMAWPRSELVPVDVQLAASAPNVAIYDAAHHLIDSQVLATFPATNQFHLLIAPTEIPAVGYIVLHAEPAPAPVAEIVIANASQPDLVSLGNETKRFVVSNLKLMFAIDKQTGCITRLSESVIPMQSPGPRQFLAPNACGNQLQTYADNPKQYDAWNIDPGTLDGKMTPIDTLDSIQVVADGPLRKTIEIKRTWQHSHFTQDISLDAGSDFVRVETTVDWHEDHVLLKAAFPLAHSGPKATYEIPYGAIERPTTRNNSWEKAQFEVPALRWADLGDSTAGVSILNDSKYGYDALGNTLRLTLLRSPTWPDPEADRGLQHFTYEIYPHTGTWQTAQTVHRGYELNTPLTAQQVFPHTGSLPASYSFASIDEPNIILSAVKKAEDTNALIFRFYDSNGKGSAAHLHIPPGALYAVETNLMETPIPNAPHLPIANDTITLPINPWEIRTLQVVYPTK